MLFCFCFPPCPRGTEDDADGEGGGVARVLEEMATVTAPPARADSSGGSVLYLFPLPVGVFVSRLSDSIRKG